MNPRGFKGLKDRTVVIAIQNGLSLVDYLHAMLGCRVLQGTKTEVHQHPQQP
jgi:hypothetical protein